MYIHSLLLGGRTLLCSLGWHGAHSVVQAAFGIPGLPASAPLPEWQDLGSVYLAHLVAIHFNSEESSFT